MKSYIHYAILGFLFVGCASHEHKIQATNSVTPPPAIHQPPVPSQNIVLPQAKTMPLLEDQVNTLQKSNLPPWQGPNFVGHFKQKATELAVDHQGDLYVNLRTRRRAGYYATNLYQYSAIGKASESIYNGSSHPGGLALTQNYIWQPVSTFYGRPLYKFNILDRDLKDQCEHKSKVCNITVPGGIGSDPTETGLAFQPLKEEVAFMDNTPASLGRTTVYTMKNERRFVLFTSHVPVSAPDKLDGYNLENSKRDFTTAPDSAENVSYVVFYIPKAGCKYDHFACPAIINIQKIQAHKVIWSKSMKFDEPVQLMDVSANNDFIPILINIGSNDPKKARSQIIWMTSNGEIESREDLPLEKLRSFYTDIPKEKKYDLVPHMKGIKIDQYARVLLYSDNAVLTGTRLGISHHYLLNSYKPNAIKKGTIKSSSFSGDHVYLIGHTTTAYGKTKQPKDKFNISLLGSFIQPLDFQMRER